jgi:hypothetical protein
LEPLVVLPDEFPDFCYSNVSVRKNAFRVDSGIGVFCQEVSVNHRSPSELKRNSSRMFVTDRTFQTLLEALRFAARISPGGCKGAAVL